MHRTNQRGFTLLEVLLAFAILSLTLAMIFRAFSQGAYGTQISHQQLALVSLAEAKFASAGIDTKLTPGNFEGYSAKGLHWQIEVARLDEFKEFTEATGISVFSLAVTTSWPNQAKVRPVRLKTVKFVRR